MFSFQFWFAGKIIYLNIYVLYYQWFSKQFTVFKNTIQCNCKTTFESTVLEIEYVKLSKKYEHIRVHKNVCGSIIVHNCFNEPRLSHGMGKV